LERLELSSLSPAKAAAEIGISIRYLHAIFRDEGTTFSKWLWLQRLEACRVKINSPEFAEQSIAALAVESGFSNFSHFSRRFRQAYGVSARDMRVQLLRNELRPPND
jgi:AraC family transcriptional regulator, positive regulator of tynA and feaB